MAPSSDFTLRAMTVADIAGGLRLSHASGWNQLADDWRVFIETPGSGAFLVERDGAVLGTSAYIRYDSLAWVAMMLVDPGERRSGLGSRLLEAALEALRDLPCVGLDATPLGAPLYRKHGFVEHSELVRMKGVVRLESAGRARAMQASDLAEVCQLDREVFGADRSQLLAELLRRAPECAWVVRDGCGLAGVLLRTAGTFVYPIGSRGGFRCGGGSRACITGLRPVHRQDCRCAGRTACPTEFSRLT